MKPFLKTVLGWFSNLKNIQVIALIIAGPVFTFISLAYMVTVVVRPWTPDQQGLQLEILRDGIMYIHGLMFVTILALTAGLIRSVKVGIGKLSAELDLADEYDAVAPYKSSGSDDDSSEYAPYDDESESSYGPPYGGRRGR